jgi:hypothetical protein
MAMSFGLIVPKLVIDRLCESSTRKKLCRCEADLMAVAAPEHVVGRKVLDLKRCRLGSGLGAGWAQRPSREMRKRRGSASGLQERAVAKNRRQGLFMSAVEGLTRWHSGAFPVWEFVGRAVFVVWRR